MIDLYGSAEKRLTEKIEHDTVKFPAQNYIMYCVMGIIFKFKGNLEQAKAFAELADKNATTETNALWGPQKKKYGTVKERKKWLDNLVGRNKNRG